MTKFLPPQKFKSVKAPESGPCTTKRRSIQAAKLGLAATLSLGISGTLDSCTYAPVSSAQGATTYHHSPSYYKLTASQAAPHPAIETDAVTHCSGKAQPGTVRLAAYVKRTWHTGGPQIYSCRKVRGGDGLSLHAEGRAADLFLDAGSRTERARGNAVFRWVIQHAGQLGVQEVIWNRDIWSPGKGLHAYYGDNPHTDHVHIGQNRQMAASYRAPSTRRVNASAASDACTTIPLISTEYGAPSNMGHSTTNNNESGSPIDYPQIHHPFEKAAREARLDCAGHAGMELGV
ncbi:MAG TPA: hypothetical protein VMY99_01495 [Nevskiaceae bacterium]|nr:hypothetical protein [Nevskiaceae bacterium]